MFDQVHIGPGLGGSGLSISRSQGLPETNPLDANDRQSAPDTAPTARPTLWIWIALPLAGLVAFPTAAPRLRRRVLALASARH
jgi:hypothetical protein